MGAFCGSADSAGLRGEKQEHAGAGVKADFNAEDKECTGKGKKVLGGVGSDHSG